MWVRGGDGTPLGNLHRLVLLRPWHGAPAETAAIAILTSAMPLIFVTAASATHGALTACIAPIASAASRHLSFHVFTDRGRSDRTHEPAAVPQLPHRPQYAQRLLLHVLQLLKPPSRQRTSMRAGTPVKIHGWHMQKLHAPGPA